MLVSMYILYISARRDDLPDGAKDHFARLCATDDTGEAIKIALLLVALHGVQVFRQLIRASHC